MLGVRLLNPKVFVLYVPVSIIGVLVNSSRRAYSAFERLAYSTAYALPLPGELGDEPLLRIFGNRLFFFLGLGRGGSFEP